MAKFCGKCGKPLQDGEVCSCSLGSEQEQTTTSVVNEAQTNNAQQGSVQQPVQPGYTYGQTTQGEQQPTMQGQPMQGQPMQSQGAPSQFSQQASQAAAVAGKYAKNVWKMLLDMWKAPADNVKSFVDEKNFTNALILVGVQAVLSMIFSCLLLRKAYSAIMSLFGGFSYLMSDAVKIPYAKTAFTTLIFIILFAATFAGISMIVEKQFAKVNMTFKEAVCLAAVKVAPTLPFIAVGIVTSLFNLYLTLAVVSLGGIAGYLYVHTALNNGKVQDENKRVFTSFLILGLDMLVTLFIMYIYIKMQ
ncbi:hypothetical protein [Anaerosporobacter faecicola]|uniref:hypothetical protein n=1 Tax=Anaerosporobacter faecicola TaxID=2718714 RepID=UPI00143C32C8|nr:hypothetical protein [Anaerosporobacter faecicola]